MPQKQTTKCPECGKVFSNARALGSHRRYVHGVLGVQKVRPGRYGPMRQLAKAQAEIEKLRRDAEKSAQQEKALQAAQEELRRLQQQVSEQLKALEKTLRPKRRKS
jgi:septal ring factor EnvC (AmiA/AmiB activator)